MTRLLEHLFSEETAQNWSVCVEVPGCGALMSVGIIGDHVAYAAKRSSHGVTGTGTAIAQVADVLESGVLPGAAGLERPDLVSAAGHVFPAANMCQ